MKYSQVVGIIAAVVLVVSCMVNWTWYPDIKQYFTAFYSTDNMYGKPGKVFIFLAILASFFYAVPRVWAKRWNFFVCGLTVAYAIKTFILFTSCYRGICPEKQPGIWVMMGSSVLMLVMSFLPDLKMKEKQAANNT